LCRWGLLTERHHIQTWCASLTARLSQATLRTIQKGNLGGRILKPKTLSHNASLNGLTLSREPTHKISTLPSEFLHQTFLSNSPAIMSRICQKCTHFFIERHSAPTKSLANHTTQGQGLFNYSCCHEERPLVQYGSDYLLYRYITFGDCYHRSTAGIRMMCKT